MDSFPDYHHDQKAIQAHLIHGRELANQLRLTLEKPPCRPAAAAAADDDDDGRLVVADDLLTKIFQSFSETISLLSREKTNDVSRIPDCVQVAASCCLEGQRCEDSEESSKTSAPKNDRRGCYNKRRRSSQILTRVTSDLIDDGHAWRKYGQKAILNAKHPRNYYRCTHKFDQGCQATKQVQKINDDDDDHDGPAKYRITYHCQHTCKKLVTPPKVILDSDYHFPVGESLNSRFLSFAKSNPNNNYYPNNALHDHNDSVISQTFPPSFIKQQAEEYCGGEKEKPNLYDVNYNNQSPSLSDYFLCSDLMRSEYSSGLTDHGDVISSSGMYSCTMSTHSHGLDMDMDLMEGSSDFHDDVSQYEFCF